MESQVGKDKTQALSLLKWSGEIINRTLINKLGPFTEGGMRENGIEKEIVCVS